MVGDVKALMPQNSGGTAVAREQRDAGVEAPMAERGQEGRQFVPRRR